MANFTPQEIEQFLQEFFDVVGARQYVGARYVPIFGRRGEDTVEWDNRAPYEPLTVVMHNGISFVSRRYVPNGIEVTDTDYWAETYRFNAQVEQYRQEVLSFQSQIDGLRDDMESDYVPFPDSATYPKYGTNGQVLTTLANGSTRWEDPVVPSDAQAEAIITQWLDEHPEATTTVEDNSLTTAKYQDGSVTDAKLAPNGVLSTVSGLETALDTTQIRVPDISLWEQGTIASATGEDTVSGTHLRTADYIDTDIIYGAYSLTGYQFAIVGYDSTDSDAYVGIWNGTEFSQAGTNIWQTDTIYLDSIGLPTYKYRLICRKYSQTTIRVDTDAQNIILYKRFVTDETLTKLGYPADAKYTGYLKNQLADINSGSLHFEKYYLKNDNIVTLNYTTPNRGHSALFRAKENITLIPRGIPEGATVQLYVVDTLTESLQGKNTRLYNDREYTIGINKYYRFGISTTDDSDASAIDTIYFDRVATDQTNYFDVIMFAGQSNMAGRGVSNATHPETYPTAISGSGYEYRAISDPTKLYPLTEPFGYAEDNPNGLDDQGRKTGSAVVAFINAYYTYGKVPVIAVSASEGGTDLKQWVTGYDVDTGRLYDAKTRLESCLQYCTQNSIPVRHVYVVWLQGESDAKKISDGETDFTIQTYTDRFETCQQAFIDAGAEKVLVIRIGKRAGDSGEDSGLTTYDDVIELQTQLTETDTDLVMVSTDLAGMRARGLMKDQSHYYQAAYNEFGTYSGINAAIYANSGKEPTMYDTYYDNLYYSHKN